MRLILRYRYVMTLLSFVFMLSSCDKAHGPIVPEIVSFQNDVQPIFDQNCISCHPNSGDMSLKEGESYSNLVNVISPNYLLARVSPFNADSSVICMKLHGVEGYGFQMPLNGIPLEDEEIKTIEAWIDQGALDN